jgi:hypothetical protein
MNSKRSLQSHNKIKIKKAKNIRKTTNDSIENMRDIDETSSKKDHPNPLDAQVTPVDVVRLGAEVTQVAEVTLV